MLQHIRKTKRLASRLAKKALPSYRINHRNRGIINFIDVGSLGGLVPPWDSNANRVKFLLNFEPNDAPVRKPSSVTYNTAVWESDGVFPFFIYKGLNASGSSLFKQNYDYVRQNYDDLKTRGPQSLAETWFERSELVKTIELKCRTLDNIIKDDFPSVPFHFMKIDAQGAEYNILKGADNLLRGDCIGLHLELFVIPLYEGIVLLDDVKAYLKQFGFQLKRRFPAHGTFDSQHDCLFLKDDGNPARLAEIRKVYGIR